MLFVLSPLPLTLIFLPGGIPCFQTKFLFEVGSIASRPNFSSGWDPGFFTRFIFSSINQFIFLFIYIFSFEKNPFIYCFIFSLFNVFSMPQVIEQSLFLFFIKVQSKSVPVAAPMAKEAEDSTASSCREQKSLKMQRKTFF